MEKLDRDKFHLRSLPAAAAAWPCGQVLVLAKSDPITKNNRPPKSYHHIYIIITSSMDALLVVRLASVFFFLLSKGRMRDALQHISSFPLKPVFANDQPTDADKAPMDSCRHLRSQG